MVAKTHYTVQQMVISFWTSTFRFWFHHEDDSTIFL